MASVVRNTGRISASSAVNNGGVIELVANTVTQAGTVAANGSGQGSVGGQINVVGKNITLASGSKTTATGNAGGGSIEIGLGNTVATNLHQAKTSALDSRDFSAPVKVKDQVARAQATNTQVVTQTAAPANATPVAPLVASASAANTRSLSLTLDQLQANAVAKAQASSAAGLMAKTVTVQSNSIVNASATKAGNGGSIIVGV